MRSSTFSIRRLSWEEGRKALSTVRRAVFIEEQGVPEELEWDEEDATAVHLLATDANGAPIGTARLLPIGQIGRMAVLREWRRRGVGRVLLDELVHIAGQSDYPPLFLNAQTHVIDFYRRAGFEPEGGIFLDAGIPHRRMRRITTGENSL
ncbi:MAG TPA: GNAT family N-acetyltransferase [Chromatiales bacterium]|nr:GNAT family N-acetyltransferase [Chromatiales bacterium]